MDNKNSLESISSAEFLPSVSKQKILDGKMDITINGTVVKHVKVCDWTSFSPTIPRMMRGLVACIMQKFHTQIKASDGRTYFISLKDFKHKHSVAIRNKGQKTTHWDPKDKELALYAKAVKKQLNEITSEDAYKAARKIYKGRLRSLFHELVEQREGAISHVEENEMLLPWQKATRNILHIRKENGNIEVLFGDQEKISSGTFKRVSKVQNLATKRFEAFGTVEAFSSKELKKAKENIQREAAIYQTLKQKGIDNIVGVRTVTPLSSSQEAIPGFAVMMEYCSGGDMSALLSSRRGIGMRGESTKRNIDVFEKLCAVAKTLSKIHAAGYVHCDIKPANVLLDGEGIPKISDFGLCDVIGESYRGGTPYYMPPECFIQGQFPKIGRLHDAYSLGVMIYEYATGKTYATSDMKKVMSVRGDATHVHNTYNEGRKNIKNIPDPDLRRICEGLLRVSPATRKSTLWAARKLEAYVQKLKALDSTQASSHSKSRPSSAH